MSKGGAIRIGIGGWTYEPWRGTFYPDDLKQKDELSYAGEKLTALEINGTFYRAQKPETYAKWRDAVPEGFVYSLKAPRYATNRKALGEAGESIERFVTGGIAELGDKLGPIHWQLAETKKFDPDEIASFLALLPAKAEGVPLRHAIELRHESFRTPEMVELARKHDVAIVRAVDSRFPEFSDITSDFAYLRLMGTTDKHVDGYSKKALDGWAENLKALSEGTSPPGPEPVIERPAMRALDVYCFFISGYKERNPAAALALLERLG